MTMYAPEFTRDGIDQAWPDWVKRFDLIWPGHVVLRISWWRWLTWWRLRDFRAWVREMKPVGATVDIRGTW